jgi:hypothetical protein
MSFAEVIKRTRQFRDKQLDGAANGLDAYSATITDRMRATNAHGDVSGATRASYTARRVGRGETGAAAFAQAQAAAEAKNPGKTESGSVAVGGELGVILDSPTTYQVDLETEHAGLHAVLGPTLQAEANAITAAAARGARENV